ncbi:SCO family protein [Chitinivorax sp. B]|uniref:SCO family protein n=1 Tax=Chitinivorax sp. B TaxID=2502235 RepID=UPI0010F8170E|nr:SCO family protein [Chitinivorax sp. B]
MLPVVNRFKTGLLGRRRVVLKLSVVALAASLLLGCERAPEAPKLAFQATDVTGSTIGGDFQLTDHHGQPRRLSDYRGKIVVMFFGYTHCPDVCPTTMIELKKVMTKLGAAAKDIQVLFVTVDPERDTPEVLKQYVPAFHSSFIGLYGTPAQLTEVTRAFKIVAQKSPTEGGGYTMDHSAGTYLFDREGNIRVFVNYGAGAAVFENDLRQLLKVNSVR